MELAHRELTNVYNDIATVPPHTLAPRTASPPDQSSAHKVKNEWHSRAPLAFPADELEKELSQMRALTRSTSEPDPSMPYTHDITLDNHSTNDVMLGSVASVVPTNAHMGPHVNRGSRTRPDGLTEYESGAHRRPY